MVTLCLSESSRWLNEKGVHHSANYFTSCLYVWISKLPNCTWMAHWPPQAHKRSEPLWRADVLCSHSIHSGYRADHFLRGRWVQQLLVTAIEWDRFCPVVFKCCLLLRNRAPNNAGANKFAKEILLQYENESSWISNRVKKCKELSFPFKLILLTRVL